MVNDNKISVDSMIRELEHRIWEFQSESDEENQKIIGGLHDLINRITSNMLRPTSIKSIPISKPFEEVQIGDEAFDCDLKEFAGRVLDKGTWQELCKRYNSTYHYEDIEGDEDWDKDSLLECVAITQDPTRTLHGFNNLIYIYDFDPSSVVCYY